MCELLGLVMLPLQELSGHVATLPGSDAVAFSNVAFFEKSHLQYRVKQCKEEVSHLAKPNPCLDPVFFNVA